MQRPAAAPPKGSVVVTEVAGEGLAAALPGKPAAVREVAGEGLPAAPTEPARDRNVTGGRQPAATTEPAREREVAGEGPPAEPTEGPTVLRRFIKDAPRRRRVPSHMWPDVNLPMCHPLSCNIVRHDRHYRPP